MNRWLLLRKQLLSRWPGRILLRLLSWVYGLGVLLRQLGYALRLFPSHQLPVKTVCVGNLTTGGTGKTSAILLAAETYRRNDVHVAILSRGYRRPEPTKEVQVLSEGTDTPWTRVGDEPWMMHQALKNIHVPVLIAPNRYRAGLEAVKTFKSQVLLLDDGYQHFKLRRDLDIVIVNALDPFGGGYLLPRGNLREPLRGLRRAGMIVITHSDQVPPPRLLEIKNRLFAIHPYATIVEAIHSPDFFYDLKNQAKLPLDHLKSKSIVSFCAIGDPISFESQIRRLGARVSQSWRYPDHHPFTLDELRSIEQVRERRTVVTTLKDVPRLPKGWAETLTGETLALVIRLEITQGRDVWEAKLQKIKKPGKARHSRESGNPN